MAFIFMKRKSTVFEVFNFKYWKVRQMSQSITSSFMIPYICVEVTNQYDTGPILQDGYRHSILNYGLKHRWIQNIVPTHWTRLPLAMISQDTCMSSSICRRYKVTPQLQCFMKTSNRFIFSVFYLLLFNFQFLTFDFY